MSREFSKGIFKFMSFKQTPNAPWKKYYKSEEMNFKVPDISIYNYFEKKASSYGDLNAIDYCGRKIKYSELLEKVDRCAKSFYFNGIRAGDVVTLIMSNTPEAVISFLALNKIGAISNMLHHLSSENEIKKTIISTNSKMLLIIDYVYEKVKKILKATNLLKVIVVKTNNAMPLVANLEYNISHLFDYNLPKNSNFYVYWNDFFYSSNDINVSDYKRNTKKNTPAVMIHSGGSTGVPKAIMISNGNFVTFSIQSGIIYKEIEIGDKNLAMMPIFHGFGLATNVYFPLTMGMEVILIPRFQASKFEKILNDYKPEFVMAVPTIYEEMLKIDNNNLDMSNLKYALSGGDILKKSLEDRINDFFLAHNSKVKISCGFGMSEALTGVVCETNEVNRDGTVGIPLPGCYVGIFSSDDQELPYDQDGEICISGPNVMLGYYNNIKETNLALHVHDDGNIWLHSGDIGSMDKDGFITYKGRIKRMIVTSGYNVYPSQIEELLETHPAIMLCNVVGVPDSRKGEVIKAYIVLNKGFLPFPALIKNFKKLCEKNLPKYAHPSDYEFRKSLPRTIVGKIDFKALQDENR